MKNRIPLLILVTLLIVGIIYVYNLTKGGGAGSNLVTCIDIKVTSCDLDSLGGYIYGTVTNQCGVKANAIKIVASAYDANGTLLSSDDEYIENLAPGAQETFKAIMDQPAAQGKTCKAKIDTAY